MMDPIKDNGEKKNLSQIYGQVIEKAPYIQEQNKPTNKNRVWGFGDRQPGKAHVSGTNHTSHFKIYFIYLMGSYSKRKSSICWLIPTMTARARAGPMWNQKPEDFSGSPT